MSDDLDRKKWLTWHAEYDGDSRRLARLNTVRLHIRACLDALPPGPISVLSICAGDGRDLRGALSGHPRATDVQAFLIEIDDHLVEQGRAAAEASGLASHMRFLCGDATSAALYESIAPADIVLLCGVLRHVRRRDAPRLVQAMTSVCAKGGFVIWTRRVTDFGTMFRVSEPLLSVRRFLAQRSAADANEVRSLLRQSSFEEVRVDGEYDLVVTSRHLGESEPLARDRALFRLATS